MRFDTASKTLILAAHMVEHGDPHPHPLSAVAEAAQVRGYSGWRSRYEKSATRLLAANGPDLADLSQEEKIDILVAAAFWEVA